MGSLSNSQLRLKGETQVLMPVYVELKIDLHNDGMSSLQER